MSISYEAHEHIAAAQALCFAAADIRLAIRVSKGNRYLHTLLCAASKNLSTVLKTVPACPKCGSLTNTLAKTCWVCDLPQAVRPPRCSSCGDALTEDEQPHGCCAPCDQFETERRLERGQ